MAKSAVMNFFMKGLIPLAILAAGLVIGGWFFANPDEAQKRPRPEAQALLVETGNGSYGTFKAQVEAMGQVVPAVAATLKPQVAGEILDVSPEFVPGGAFEKDAVILQIDPEDYELAVRKQQAVLEQAKAAYDLEMGRQSVARDELKILERTTGHKPDNPQLALRGPQLAQAKAELDKAQADLDVAKLNLQRAVIVAPFNALVVSRSATLGDKVSSGQELAELVKTDEYWVELSLPVHDLRWLKLPQPESGGGSNAVIYLDGGRGERYGMLMKLSGALDTDSRLATVLVSVPDPLGKDTDGAAAPLILGDYVRVVLEGQALENTVRIPLGWLRDDGIVWVKKDGVMEFRPVVSIYQDREYAYISEGIAPDDVIVTSDIAVPVKDMKIRTAEEARKAMQDQMNGPKGGQD
ncbi:MAG: efflux RND transporter periplasmic adaptor subunit [Rhodospirillales bacterium]|nr:efflux RND transporter periplasmic adaptor subunit [Rhodospirillales bacterium]MCB9994895.1 efflux RND transporter periplasmic adaptor subunit [Rhodospirillales bacterium]